MLFFSTARLLTIDLLESYGFEIFRILPSDGLTLFSLAAILASLSRTLSRMIRGSDALQNRRSSGLTHEPTPRFGFNTQHHRHDAQDLRPATWVVFKIHGGSR